MLGHFLKLKLLREVVWMVPFLCIALVAFGLFRPQPHIPSPEHSRTVMSSDGVPVRIALPFRGVAIAPNYSAGWLLEDTLSPDLLLYAGNSEAREVFAKSLMGQIFPEVSQNDNLWGASLFQHSSSPFVELETLLAYDPGVYLGCAGPRDLMRNLGLPVLNSRGSCGVGKKPIFACAGSSPSNYWAYYPEGPLFIPLKVDLDLAGHPEQAQARMASYCRVITDLQQELQPATLANSPHVLMSGEYGGDFARTGVVNIELERKIPGDDAERILIMDPDMIFAARGDPRKFMRDPTWQGLKAVQERRVYKWTQYGLTYKPIQIRWMAELVHPERLQPKARQMLRDRVISELGYRLSDEEIDKVLNVEENSGSAGAERFTRDYRAESRQEVSK